MLPAPARAERAIVTEFTSTDEVVAAFLSALERKDLEALRRLRVTEAEYKDLILPGSVPEGQPFRAYRPDVVDYAWQTLNTKSLYYERYLLTSHGGRSYELQDVRFERGTEKYAGYSTHKQLRLSVVHDGEPVEIGTGSIVEVGGRYKFASFIRD
jgi:hypothetical protein